MDDDGKRDSVWNAGLGRSRVGVGGVEFTGVPLLGVISLGVAAT